MSDFFAQYGLFVAKALTVLLVFAACVLVVAVARRSAQADTSTLEIKKLNDDLDDMKDALESQVYNSRELKLIDEEREKEEKAKQKKQKKEAKSQAKQVKSGKAEAQSLITRRPRTYVLDFDGDIEASQVKSLRRCITAVLTLAQSEDEVVIRLTSPGGLVHAYGLAASQLERIKRADVPLVVCVDGVAASGGYMMACIANRILAAPFAVVGSIGVVAEVPNVNRLLKKHDVDYDVYTAGEFKRTVTVFGENTEQGKEKFVQDLEKTHGLFKDFVSKHREAVDIDQVATGETWYGTQAIDAGLVDELMTSDQYLSEQCETRDVFTVALKPKKSLDNRLAKLLSDSAGRMSRGLVKGAFDEVQRRRLY